MNQIDAVVDTIIHICKLEPSLLGVKRYRRINGLVPGVTGPEISVGSDEENYETYTRDQDECEARINIFVYLESKDLERGEYRVREIARNVRRALVEQYTLLGKAASSYPGKIKMVYSEEHHDLQAALIEMDVKLYEPRLDPFGTITLPLHRGSGEGDDLPVTPVVKLVEVPGYSPGDYILDGDRIKWPGHTKPTTGTDYDVTWKYDRRVAVIRPDMNEETIEIP